MGAYLSEPVTEKISTDESNAFVQCGASCMQGWRINQEDAHNTTLDFDKDAMLFAVYDGHGGAEVASYCAQKLPDYIKNTEAYKSGNLEKALEDAFLGFDALIASKDVMEVLKEIAGQLNPPVEENGDSSEDEENVNNLYQDANMTLQEVLATYKWDKAAAAMRAKLGDDVPLSPCLRGKKDKENASKEGGASSSSSGGSGPSSQPGGSGVPGEGSGDAGEGSSSNAVVGKSDGDVTSSTSNNDASNEELNGEVSTSDDDKSSARDAAKTKETTSTAPDSSEDTHEQPQQSETAKSDLCNGDVTEGKATAENSISSSQNGDSGKSGKGKSLDKAKVSSTEEPLSPAAERRKKMVPRRAAADMFKSLLMGAACQDDDDDSDSNDENFEGAASTSSDDDNVNGANESSEEGEESEDEEAEEEEDSSDEEYPGTGAMEEPGSDSGCTAVVAILRGNQLFVGNAGDSRCIVCREGVAVDMSIDHKPEDAPELERITKAGGKVSQDGRINGGLNLSRAIGDHAYKQNKDLDAKEQMITALPDVKTLTIDPEKDEFMLLACDGIWNFMSSQDVCDFISPRLKEGRERLSQICEEMFDHCLAPNTVGDGTGCDNMTAVLVTFKKNAAGNTEVASVTTTESTKRAAEPEQTSEPKRQKVDDSCSVVTSSV